LETAGLDASTLKKVGTRVQGLADMLGGVEASQKATKQAWSQSMAKVQSRLQAIPPAVAPGQPDKDQDAEKTNLQELEAIVGDIQRFYQNRDLAALQLATDLPPKQGEVLRALFANWASFTVHIRIDAIDQDSAKIIVELHDMVDKRGKRAKPRQEEIIGRQVLHISRQGGEWGKPQW